MHTWTARDVAGDPEGEAAADWLQGHYLRSFVERYEQWLSRQRSWPLEWRTAAASSDWVVRVSPARLTELLAELDHLVTRYRDPEPEDPAAVPVQLYLHTFPD